jgi:hypothetical protein
VWQAAQLAGLFTLACAQTAASTFRCSRRNQAERVMRSCGGASLPRRPVPAFACSQL